MELRGGAYKHPAIVATLRSMFSGPASPGQVLKSAFSSSLDEKEYPDSEPEVPMSMVALAAAAVCLSLLFAIVVTVTHCDDCRFIFVCPNGLPALCIHRNSRVTRLGQSTARIWNSCKPFGRTTRYGTIFSCQIC